MRNLIAFPLLGLAVMVQSVVVSRITLLSGYADLVLVILAAWSLQERVTSAWHWAFLSCILIGFVSHLSWFVVVAGYFSVVLMARLFQQRVWQAPLLAMFSITFMGTLFMHFLTYAFLRLSGTPLEISDVLSLITLPSLLLNMLFAIPVYTFIRDLARWVYPSEVVE